MFTTRERQWQMAWLAMPDCSLQRATWPYMVRCCLTRGAMVGGLTFSLKLSKGIPGNTAIKVDEGLGLTVGTRIQKRSILRSWHRLAPSAIPDIPGRQSG